METGSQALSDMGRSFSLSASGVIIELWTYPFFASWIVMSKSGTVNNSLFCIILSDTLVENWATCFQMCRNTASLFHLAIIIIVGGVTTAMYIVIASLEQRECATISMGPKPNRLLPIIWTVARNFVQIPAEVVANLFSPVSMKVLT